MFGDDSSLGMVAEAEGEPTILTVISCIGENRPRLDYKRRDEQPMHIQNLNCVSAALASHWTKQCQQNAHP
jgi:hypothetical protein